LQPAQDQVSGAVLAQVEPTPAARGNARRRVSGISTEAHAVVGIDGPRTVSGDGGFSFGVVEHGIGGADHRSQHLRVAHELRVTTLVAPSMA
jgi:hypothetical protein